jgi:NodT family efflux transporter outer membrane factor (OMF) lipoprotein
MNRRINPLLASLLVLAGCTTAGPYQGPPPVAAASQSRGSFQRAEPAVMSAEVSPSDWWSALHDPLLDTLIAGALRDSPALAAADARIERVRALQRERRAALSPVIGIGAVGLGGVTGSDDSGRAHLAGLDASWEPDLAGGQRRRVDQAGADAEAAAADRDADRVRLIAEIGQSYVALREAQQQLMLAERGVSLHQERLALTVQRLRAGAGTGDAVELCKIDLAGAEARASEWRGAADIERDRLAMLVGQEPGALDTALAAPGSLPLPPAMVAVGDPAALLRQRPDIRAAERRLAASNAVVGQALAARFPKVNLIGLLGFAGVNLFGQGGDDAIALAAPTLRWTLFDFGQTKARIDGANAAQQEAEAQYRAVVLAALADAENGLTRYGQSRQQLASVYRQFQAAQAIARLADQRTTAGAASRLDGIGPALRVLATEQAQLSAQAQLMSRYIALQKSLGLGWTVDAPPR